jgi:hypothetical protein
MSTRKITDLPKKNVSSEQAGDVKGGRKAARFGGKRGRSKGGAIKGGAIKLTPQ